MWFPRPTPALELITNQWKIISHNLHKKQNKARARSFLLLLCPIFSFSPLRVNNSTALQLKLMALLLCMYIYSIINLFVAPGSCLAPERMLRTVLPDGDCCHAGVFFAASHSDPTSSSRAGRPLSPRCVLQRGDAAAPGQAPSPISKDIQANSADNDSRCLLGSGHVIAL